MELNGSQTVTVNDIVRSLEQLNSSIGLYDLQQVSFHGHHGQHGHYDLSVGVNKIVMLFAISSMACQ